MKANEFLNALQSELQFEKVAVEALPEKIFADTGVEVNVLRLDKIHAVVSGNKWFKLKYYLQHAVKEKYTTIATFGGAFSNHILATAYTCNKHNLKCVGFIRGEEPKNYSATLLDAVALNMQLKFLSRQGYSNKEAIINNNPEMFFIPEGGFGKTGTKGAAEIIKLVTDFSTYNYIICAVGSGTMLAGISNACKPHQQCTGISVLKNNPGIEEQVHLLLNNISNNNVKILHDYHFGGYAKCTQQLIDFMNNCYTIHHLPLDFIYTGKALYAVYNLCAKHFFNQGSKILFIHSGGLQGNRSLKNKLLFSQT